jgi:hypothetical protein
MDWPLSIFAYFANCFTVVKENIEASSDNKKKNMDTLAASVCVSKTHYL